MFILYLYVYGVYLVLISIIAFILWTIAYPVSCYCLSSLKYCLSCFATVWAIIKSLPVSCGVIMYTSQRYDRNNHASVDQIVSLTINNVLRYALSRHGFVLIQNVSWPENNVLWVLLVTTRQCSMILLTTKQRVLVILLTTKQRCVILLNSKQRCMSLLTTKRVVWPSFLQNNAVWYYWLYETRLYGSPSYKTTLCDSPDHKTTLYAGSSFLQNNVVCRILFPTEQRCMPDPPSYRTTLCDPPAYKTTLCDSPSYKTTLYIVLWCLLLIAEVTKRTGYIHCNAVWFGCDA